MAPPRDGRTRARPGPNILARERAREGDPGFGREGNEWAVAAISMNIHERQKNDRRKKNSVDSSRPVSRRSDHDGAG